LPRQAGCAGSTKKADALLRFSDPSS
jgi:hypothetical protein